MSTVTSDESKKEVIPRQKTWKGGKKNQYCIGRGIMGPGCGCGKKELDVPHPARGKKKRKEPKEHKGKMFPRASQVGCLPKGQMGGADCKEGLRGAESDDRRVVHRGPRNQK